MALRTRTTQYINTIAGPTGPTGSIPNVNFKVKSTPTIDMISNTMISSLSLDVQYDIFSANLNSNLNNPEQNTILRGNDQILINGYLDTKTNFSTLVIDNASIGTLGNNITEEQKTKIMLYLTDHVRIKFENINNDYFKWNLDMTKFDSTIYYKDVYINPTKFSVANIIIPTQQVLTSLNSINGIQGIQSIQGVQGVPGFVPGNDMFIRLPYLSKCRVGQEFNFYILNKVSNVYSTLDGHICPHTEYDCDCIVGSESIPRSYRVLNEKKSVNIYIFASEPEIDGTDINVSVDNHGCPPLIGPRVLNDTNKNYYYLKLDNEKSVNDRSVKKTNNFNLNPGSMSDFHHINIKVVPNFVNRSKTFLITTPLPELDYSYTTPDALCIDNLCITKV
jgi:hypothetical protein